MKNEYIDRAVVLFLALAVFSIPFLLFFLFVNLAFLFLFVSPAFSIIYLILRINSKRKSGKKLVDYKTRSRSIGFPFIVFGFVFIPLFVSVVIAFTAALDLYSVVVLMGLNSLFITSSFFIPLSIYEKYFAKEKTISGFMPPVTIIVPAYNEAKGISRTLDSIVEVDYPNKEVIVVDDGSRDLTYGIALKYKDKFRAMGNPYSVFRKPNGGKASAINYALRFSKHEIIIVVDSDSIISRNAIKSIVKHFYDDDVVAVAGYIRVLNSNNILTRCTALEVVNAWNSLGRTYSLLGSVMIVPGALGAFRKKVITQRGTYDTDTLTEDFDLTVKILKSKGIVRFEESSLSFSEIPNDLRGLYNQRKRWYTGNFQTLIKHANILTNHSYKTLHRFGYPVTLILFIYRSIWSVLIPITLILAISSGRYIPVTISILVFILLSFLLSLISIIMDGQREKLKLVLYSPLMVIGYAQILDFILIKSIFNVLFHRDLKWSRAKRIGYVGVSDKAL